MCRLCHDVVAAGCDPGCGCRYVAAAVAVAVAAAATGAVGV